MLSGPGWRVPREQIKILVLGSDCPSVEATDYERACIHSAPDFAEDPPHQLGAKAQL